MTYDDEMTERASIAFARKHNVQPCAVLSDRTGNVVTLANVNGTLARYKVLKRNNREHVRRMTE